MILGTQISKLVSGSEQLILSSSELDPKFIIPNEIEHQSIINGKRNYISIGDHSEFNVLVNIFKGKTSLDDMYNWKHKTVKFYPHSDGVNIKNNIGEDAQFHVMEIVPYYLSNDVRYDIAVMKLKSKDTISYKSTFTSQGYGFNYGQFYGESL